MQNTLAYKRRQFSNDALFVGIGLHLTYDAQIEEIHRLLRSKQYGLDIRQVLGHGSINSAASQFSSSGGKQRFSARIHSDT